MKQPTAKKAAAKPAATIVVARCDVGFGNQLFVRGEGADLDWEVGREMECRGADEWVFETAVPASDLELKFLINDRIWSAGPNVPVTAGGTTVVEPRFA